MIDLDKSQKITITVDPFTYLALEKLAEIKEKTLEEYTADIITNEEKVWNLGATMFRLWMIKDEEN